MGDEKIGGAFGHLLRRWYICTGFVLKNLADGPP